MLDYRIRTFLTLYNQLNYRKTAQLLQMTQPGVTQHIHFLENHYGTRLFTYTGKAVQPTPQAEILKRHVDSMLAEEQEIFRELGADQKTELRIGATKTIGEFVLVPAVRRFLQDENHSVNLIVDNTDNLLRMLEEARLDFAVLEGIFDKTKYPSHLYKKEAFVGICSREHPFAGKTVTLEEAFSQTLIVREPGSGTRRLLEQAILDKGYSLQNFRRVVAVSHFSVITELVEKDGAITFAYAPVAQSQPDLAVFSVEDMAIHGEFNFVYCNQQTGREKIALFLQEDRPEG